MVQGPAMRDPQRMLVGSGKFMRHVKVRVGVEVDEVALRALIQAAWEDVKRRVELG